jgi:hypothetical protein
MPDEPCTKLAGCWTKPGYRIYNLDTMIRYLDTMLRYLDTVLRYLVTMLRYMDTAQIPRRTWTPG